MISPLNSIHNCIFLVIGDAARCWLAKIILEHRDVIFDGAQTRKLAALYDPDLLGMQSFKKMAMVLCSYLGALSLSKISQKYAAAKLTLAYQDRSQTMTTTITLSFVLLSSWLSSTSFYPQATKEQGALDCILFAGNLEMKTAD